MSKPKWQCEDCGDIFTTKKDLVKHLKDWELPEAQQRLWEIEGQLDDLGVEL